jgi:hypothetical protein
VSFFESFADFKVNFTKKMSISTIGEKDKKAIAFLGTILKASNPLTSNTNNLEVLSFCP